MNTKLTIKNFRVFDENGVMVNLKPITVLTGCNSSGKSSVVKAAMMLNDVLRQFKDVIKGGLVSANIDFTTYPNNLLGGFDKVLHNTKSGKFSFEYTIYSYLISKDVTVTLDFVADKSNKLNNAHLDKFEVKTEDGIIFWLEQNKEEEARRKEFKVKEFTEYMKFGSDEYEDTPKTSFYSRRVNVNLIRKQFVEFAVFKNIQKHFLSNNFNFEEQLTEFSEEDYKKENERLNKILNDSVSRHQLEKSRWNDIYRMGNSICSDNDLDIIEKIRTDNSLFYIPVIEELDNNGKKEIKNIINNDLADFILSKIGENVNIETIKGYIKEVIEDFLSSDAELFSTYFKQLENEYFNNALFEEGTHGTGDLGFLDFGRITHLLVSLETLWKYKQKFAKAYFIVMFLNQKLHLEDSKFYKCATDGHPIIGEAECFQHRSVEMLEEFLNTLLSECLVPSFHGTMTYVSSARAVIKRLYQLDKKDDFTVLLKTYMESKHKGTFINKWIKKFGIGDSISFETDEDGVGTKIRIHKTSDDKRGRLLADEGYGITQLLSILLQIQISPCGTTIAVEEPEIHLHPKYQSLLADMFVDAYKERDIQFIIETHSEYLIRRLQLLVAGVDTEQKLDKNDVSISYIYTKEEAEKENQPFVKNISICEDGYLDDTFGSGFFDEATKLSRKLM